MCTYIMSIRIGMYTHRDIHVHFVMCKTFSLDWQLAWTEELRLKQATAFVCEDPSTEG